MPLALHRKPGQMLAIADAIVYIQGVSFVDPATGRTVTAEQMGLGTPRVEFLLVAPDECPMDRLERLDAEEMADLQQDPAVAAFLRKVKNGEIR